MISDINEIINKFKAGEMIILIDDEERENEGDLVISSEYLTPDHINFMITKGKGLVCAPISTEVAKKLDLKLMTGVNNETETQFTASVDLKGDGVSTGISAEDRYKTIKGLCNENSTRSSFNVPGHVFPLQSMDGGVLRRAGHTEAAIDLCKLSDHYPVAVICEIINEDGSMARYDDLIKFYKNHNLPIGTIKDLIEYRINKTEMITFVSKAKVPTQYGEFTAHVYRDNLDSTEHIALTHKNYLESDETMVRVHSECLTGDVFNSLRCDCGKQLSTAISAIENNGSGILVYLRQEGRGIGLKHKIKAYKLQEEGLDTVEANEKLGFKADLRDYGVGAQILKDLGATKLTVLTNNPKKLIGLEGHGLEITSRIPIEVEANKENKNYLNTKKDKLGHILNL